MIKICTLRWCQLLPLRRNRAPRWTAHDFGQFPALFLFVSAWIAFESIVPSAISKNQYFLLPKAIFLFLGLPYFILVHLRNIFLVFLKRLLDVGMRKKSTHCIWKQGLIISNCFDFWEVYKRSPQHSLLIAESWIRNMKMEANVREPKTFSY